MDRPTISNPKRRSSEIAFLAYLIELKSTFLIFVCDFSFNDVTLGLSSPYSVVPSLPLVHSHKAAVLPKSRCGYPTIERPESTPTNFELEQQSDTTYHSNLVQKMNDTSVSEEFTKRLPRIEVWTVVLSPWNKACNITQCRTRQLTFLLILNKSYTPISAAA